MKQFKKIRLIALDVDGVLLNDTYSPAIKSFVEKHGGTYTPELERQVWGSPHIAGGHNMALACKLPWSAQKTIEAFFEHHKNYLIDNQIKVMPGVEDFLKIINQYDVKVTSYGGRTKDIFDYNFDEVLFIDDINRMAEVAKYYGSGFIGTPVTEFQEDQMKETGVKFISSSVSGINEKMLNDIDQMLLTNSVW